MRARPHSRDAARYGAPAFHAVASRTGCECTLQRVLRTTAWLVQPWKSGPRFTLRGQPAVAPSGVPKYIRSDNGSEFTAKAIREWLEKVRKNYDFDWMCTPNIASPTSRAMPEGSGTESVATRGGTPMP